MSSFIGKIALIINNTDELKKGQIIYICGCSKVDNDYWFNVSIYNSDNQWNLDINSKLYIMKSDFKIIQK